MKEELIVEEKIIDAVQEDVDVGIETKTIRFPVRVKMICDGADCNFFTSIDDLGQIILTPRTKNCSFIEAHTEWESADYIMPTDDIETESEGIKEKEFTVNITADMLKEVESESIFASIDSIGQCVIYPQKQNTFITATVGDSLNLVTEDQEPVESTEDAPSEPDLKGEILEEVSDDEPYSREQVFEELKRITHDFSDASGEVKCGFEVEKDYGVEILSEYYANVDVTRGGNWYYIEFAKENILNEDTEYTVEEIVEQFMQGKFTIYSDDSIPDGCMHISDLDSDGFEYYFDPESESMVVVNTRG